MVYNKNSMANRLELPPLQWQDWTSKTFDNLFREWEALVYQGEFFKETSYNISTNQKEKINIGLFITDSSNPTDDV